METDLTENLHHSAVLFKPIYRPYNKAAFRLVDKYHKQLGLSDTPVNGPKYKLVVASFFAAFQSVMFNTNSVLQYTINARGYVQYPLVGSQIISNTYEAMLEAGIIRLVELGERVFTDHINDSSSGDYDFKPITSKFAVNDDIINDDDFFDAAFLEVGLPVVQVSKKLPDYRAEARRVNNEPTEKIPTGKLENKFGKPYTKAVKEVKSLNAYWERNPICLPYKDRTRKLSYSRYAACATRTYHQGSMEKGGRFYGMWTNIRKEDRKIATINGNPTVQIDIAASQPTLFSCFMGEKLLVKDDDTWTDIYESVILNTPPSAAKVYGKVHRRAKVKQVIMEMIGAGNPKKPRPALSSYKVSDDEEYSFSDKLWGKVPRTEYQVIRDIALYVIPALWKLTTDKKGGLNTHFLSYHEANIMYETLIGLKKKKIVAYPLHDCLIVELGNEQEAVDTYRTTINDYCKRVFDMPFNVSVPLTVERPNQDKEKLSGNYF